jgi:hypothetical protein
MVFTYAAKPRPLYSLVARSIPLSSMRGRLLTTLSFPLYSDTMRQQSTRYLNCKVLPSRFLPCIRSHRTRPVFARQYVSTAVRRLLTVQWWSISSYRWRWARGTLPQKKQVRTCLKWGSLPVGLGHAIRFTRRNFLGTADIDLMQERSIS